MAGAGEVGGGRQQARGQGVVEGPGEGVGGGEAVDAAADGHRLVLGDSVHEVLGLVTHRGVCKQAMLCCAEGRGEYWPSLLPASSVWRVAP